MSLEETRKEMEGASRVSKSLDISLEQLKYETELEAHNIDSKVESLNEAWDSYKVKYKESVKIINPHVTPIGQQIITTATLMNAVEQKRHLINSEFDVNMIESIKNTVSDIQIVVSTGPACKEIKPGDKVKVNMDDFKRIQNPNSVHAQEVFELPLEQINKRDYIVMHERNVKYKFNK